MYYSTNSSLRVRFDRKWVLCVCTTVPIQDHTLYNIREFTNFSTSHVIPDIPEAIVLQQILLLGFQIPYHYLVHGFARECFSREPEEKIFT